MSLFWDIQAPLTSGAVAQGALGEALDGVRIVLAAAGTGFTMAVTESGEWRCLALPCGGVSHLLCPPAPCQSHTLLTLATASRMPQASPWAVLLTLCCRILYCALTADYQLPIGFGAPSAHPASLCVGRVFSFGVDFHGCLGHGQEREEAQIFPKEIAALRGVDVASVSAGCWHVLALTYNGEVYQWGAVCRALLIGYGDPPYVRGDSDRRPHPRRIEGLRDVRVRAVVSGTYHVWAVSEAGEVYTWGRNHDGCLGHGGFKDEPLPKRVEQFGRTASLWWVCPPETLILWWRARTGGSMALGH
jgi:hypothetical protein